MRRGVKIGLGVLLLSSLAAGYGVYWWHELSLDAQAVVDNPTPEQEAVAADVRKLMVATDPRDRVRAGPRLDALPERYRVKVVSVLLDDPVAAVRLAVVPYLKRMQDRVPAARADLVALAEHDPDKAVSQAAKDALGGTR